MEKCKKGFIDRIKNNLYGIVVICISIGEY